MMKYARVSRAITLTLSRERRVIRDIRKHCADLHNVRGAKRKGEKAGRKIYRVNVPIRREINKLSLEDRKRSINLGFMIFKPLSFQCPI